jgi:hypothetical protein
VFSPGVRDDQRQGVLVGRLEVDEVDVEAVDVGDERRDALVCALVAATSASTGATGRASDGLM